MSRLPFHLELELEPLERGSLRQVVTALRRSTSLERAFAGRHCGGVLGKGLSTREPLPFGGRDSRSAAGAADALVVDGEEVSVLPVAGTRWKLHHGPRADGLCGLAPPSIPPFATAAEGEREQAEADGRTRGERGQERRMG